MTFLSVACYYNVNDLTPSQTSDVGRAMAFTPSLLSLNGPQITSVWYLGGHCHKEGADKAKASRQSHRHGFHDVGLHLSVNKGPNKFVLVHEMGPGKRQEAASARENKGCYCEISVA